MAIFQIWVDFPVEKLSSFLAVGPRALRNVGEYCLALGRLWRALGGWAHRTPPFAALLSPAVCDFSELCVGTPRPPVLRNRWWP